MPRGTFRLVAYDEGGVRGSSDHCRLVCVTDVGEKLVIWGDEGKNMENINGVIDAGLPCSVDCEYREPNPIQRQEFGHRYWIRQDDLIRILR